METLHCNFQLSSLIGCSHTQNNPWIHNLKMLLTSLWEWMVLNTSTASLVYIYGSVQDCSISIANTLEILQSCTKPSIYRSQLWSSFDLQGWGAVSDLSLISDLSQKFKHDLLWVKSELNLSQKQHLTPDVLAPDGIRPSAGTMLTEKSDLFYFQVSLSMNDSVAFPGTQFHCHPKRLSKSRKISQLHKKCVKSIQFHHRVSQSLFKASWLSTQHGDMIFLSQLSTQSNGCWGHKIFVGYFWPFCQNDAIWWTKVIGNHWNPEKLRIKMSDFVISAAPADGLVP